MTAVHFWPKLAAEESWAFGQRWAAFLFSQPEDVDLVRVTSFYGLVLQVWLIFKVACTTDETPGVWLFEDPFVFFVFFKNFLDTQTRQSQRRAGCAKLEPLMIIPAVSVDPLRARSKHRLCQAE